MNKTHAMRICGVLALLPVTLAIEVFGQAASPQIEAPSTLPHPSRALPFTEGAAPHQPAGDPLDPAGNPALDPSSPSIRTSPRATPPSEFQPSLQAPDTIPRDTQVLRAEHDRLDQWLEGLDEAQKESLRRAIRQRHPSWLQSVTPEVQPIATPRIFIPDVAPDGEETSLSQAPAAASSGESVTAKSSPASDASTWSAEQWSSVMQSFREDSEIRAAMKNYLLAELAAATRGFEARHVPAETSDPYALAWGDPEVQGAVKKLVLADINHSIWSREARASVVDKTNWVSWAIFVFTHIVVLIGIVCAAKEFVRNYNRPRSGARAAGDKAPASAEHELELTMTSVKLRTQLHGLVLFVVSIGYYVLYLRFVYPIVIVGQAASQ